MKALFSILLSGILLLSTACNNSSASNATGTGNNATTDRLDTASFTAATWTDSLQNFGTVQKGKLVEIVFHVKNTGSKPLFIMSANPSCGCTVADYTKSAIAAGGTGVVTASFDSNKGLGKIHKTIAVVTNTRPTQKTLIFEGQVDDAKK